jgi:phosphoglycerol transferase MdoB-like AlkP superfamily enzyme
MAGGGKLKDVPASGPGASGRTPPAVAARPGRQVPPKVLFFVAWVLLLLVLFAALRLGLILRNRGPGDGTWGQILPAFWVGLRFDFATACYMAIPVMGLCYLPWTSPGTSPRTRRVFLWVATVFVAVVALLLVCEFEFFREFHSRFNQLAVRYLDQPQIVGGMVWYNYPVVRYVGGWLLLAIALHVALRLVLRHTWPLTAGAPRTSVRAEAIGGALVAATIVLGCRGGVQGEPLAWGDAFRSDNEFTNQMSLNGAWCLGQALRDSFGRGAHAGGWAGRMPAQEARDVARRMVVAGRERLLDPAGRTVLRDGGGGGEPSAAAAAGAAPPPVLRRADGRPVNVVVVMMESFSGRYCGAVGAPRSFTPAFDALARDGVLFDRCLSAGSHTHQGIFATLLGFPNLPGYETLMNSGTANQHFLSLPAVFGAAGYRTFFLYNGDLAWDNMRGFFRKQGVDTFVGGDDMPEAKYRDPVWGVSDGDLFDRCNAEFEAASARGPFFAAVMTLSNHAPYEVPPVPGAGPITDQGSYNKRLEAMRYADWAVGRFIEDAKRLSYFRDTLFVFVGDHGFHVPPALTEVHLLYHHVPLLFYAPGLSGRRGVDHRVASHVNVLPSVLDLLGMDAAPHAAWGRSLFDDSFPDANFAVFKQSGGGRAVALARGDDLLVLGSARGAPLLMKYDLGWPPTIRPMTAAEASVGPAMERELKAYVQAGLADLTSGRAGPATEAAP